MWIIYNLDYYTEYYFTTRTIYIYNIVNAPSDVSMIAELLIIIVEPIWNSWVLEVCFSGY